MSDDDTTHLQLFFIKQIFLTFEEDHGIFYYAIV